MDLANNYRTDLQNKKNFQYSLRSEEMDDKQTILRHKIAEFCISKRDYSGNECLRLYNLKMARRYYG